MHIESFFVEGLGHQSTLIASDETHEALVVDPRRDVEVYVEAAERAGVRIRHVLETHVHNDFLSGARALAQRVGAEHLASAEAGLQFSYRGVSEGDELHLGELLVRVLATPGHTPEHVSYAVYDTARTTEAPLVLFSGGDLLVGSVGRPDLLGRELGERLAPRLYDSIHQKLLPLGDGTMVLPTHGGGSLCGRGIAQTRGTTIGYEKLTNPFLKYPDKASFVRSVLEGNPGIPDYYRRMRPGNQAGPDGATLPDARLLPAREVEHLAGHGATLLDTRAAVAFGGGHVPGALNVGLGPMLATWVGWLIPHDAPLVLVLDRKEDWETVVPALQRIGHDSVVGYLEGGMSAWTEAGLAIERVPQLGVKEVESLRREQNRLQVLDVRTDAEWREEHIPGATHSQLGVELPRALDELPLQREQPVAVICGSGYRSSIATSLLKARGFADVSNIMGGMAAWKEAGLPTESLS